ncbi:hypothetical protein LCGC14_1680760 [marine sediment metagenome]|uniref:Uncharacterized protein n=1 Tax=marine sediment metagenome TaxID=412755 RepID=A0A0F9K4D5_9ZZZZ
MHIISRPTRREAEDRRREGLAKSGLSPKRYRGTARTTEEAHELQRGLEKEGEVFDKLWEVSGDSADAKKAEQDVVRKLGADPDSI